MIVNSDTKHSWSRKEDNSSWEETEGIQGPKRVLLSMPERPSYYMGQWRGRVWMYRRE